MTNLLKEYLAHTKDKPWVLCFRIYYEPYTIDMPLVFLLPLNYTQEEHLDVLERMREISYDSGFGSQEVYGTIWYEDDTWSDRREYDGSEWWEHQTTPEIPKELQ